MIDSQCQYTKVTDIPRKKYKHAYINYDKETESLLDSLRQSTNNVS